MARYKYKIGDILKYKNLIKIKIVNINYITKSYLVIYIIGPKYISKDKEYLVNKANLELRYTLSLSSVLSKL